jgi:hypothetical protein
LPNTDTGDATLKYAFALANQIIAGVSYEEMTATAIGWVMNYGLTIFTAAPIVGAILAGAALIWSMLGGACGEACVIAAKIEQIYEGTATNLLQLVRAGMLGSAGAVPLMYHLQGVAYTALQRLGTMAGQRGITNMFNVTNALINAARLLPAHATKPLILSDAQALYVGGPGWYSDSIELATRLTNQFINGINAKH